MGVLGWQFWSHVRPSCHEDVSTHMPIAPGLYTYCIMFYSSTSYPLLKVAWRRMHVRAVTAGAVCSSASWWSAAAAFYTVQRVLHSCLRLRLGGDSRKHAAHCVFLSSHMLHTVYTLLPGTHYRLPISPALYVSIRCGSCEHTLRRAVCECAGAQTACVLRDGLCLWQLAACSCAAGVPELCTEGVCCPCRRKRLSACCQTAIGVFQEGRCIVVACVCFLVRGCTRWCCHGAASSPCFGLRLH